MQTGPIGSWHVNPLDIGPVYPFVGFELGLVAVCSVFWIVYTVWQIRFEHERCCRETEHLLGAGALGTALERHEMELR